MSVAAPTIAASERAGAGRRAPALLAGALGLTVLASTAVVVVDSASGHSSLVPRSPQIAGWLSGLGSVLSFQTFLICLLVATAAYGALIALMGLSRARLGKRGAIALIALLHVIVFAGPILISTDVFSYIAYARMGVEHGLNPYTHGPVAIVGDPVFKYVGSDWIHVATAYGPIYTLLSYPLAPLGLVGALWGMKVLAVAASACTLALTWRCARERGFDPVLAVVIVGANPLYVIYGLGGAHNDLIMMALMMLSVSLSITGVRSGGREAGAAATIVIGALIKATVAALLPFMLLSRRRIEPLLGALAALLIGLFAGLLAFGIHGIDIISALNRDAAFVSTDSFAVELAHLAGKAGVFPVDHDLLKAGLAAIVLHLLWRTWRGYDWVAASGWALLAISVTSTWLLAWYILWPLPLAVICRDRRLLAATLAVQALFIVHQISPLLAPVE